MLRWFPASTEKQPIRTFSREPIVEQITNSQSRRCCHCYGPVRAPASWCLGARHRLASGATCSGAAGRAWLARPLPRPSPRLLARRPPLSRSSPSPGPSRSSAPRPAGCSLRARPRPMRLPTGTSPLCLRRTRKVRPRLTSGAPGRGWQSRRTPPLRSLGLRGGLRGRGRVRGATPTAGWGPRVSGSPGNPPILCKQFFPKCSAPQLLKRVRDRRVRTKWGCVALLLIGKPYPLR